MTFNSYLRSLFVLLSIAVLFLIASNSFLQQDDYCFKNDIRNMGLISNLSHNYMTYDGRAFSPIYLVRPFLVGYLSAEWNVFIVTIVFILSSLLLAYLFSRILSVPKVSLFQVVTISLIVMISLWLGMRANIARTLYWPTSNYYTYVNFILLIWIYLIFSTNQNRLILIILSLILAMSGINLAPSVIAFFILHYFFFNRYNNILTKYFIPIFLSLLLGTIIVFIAPGNFQRAANTTSGIKIDLFLMIKSFFIVSYKYLIMSKWFVVGGLITALSFNFNYFNTAINPLKLIKTGAIFILSAFASVAPFSVLPEAATKHTSVHFQLLFYIGLCLIFYSFLKKIKIKYHLYNVVLYFFILYFIVIGSQQYNMGKEVKFQLNEREKLLKMNYGRKDTMYIDKIIVPQEIFTNRYYEYSNTEPWGLECLSNYYQIKAIRLK